MRKLYNSMTNSCSFGFHAGLALSAPVVVWCLLQTRLQGDDTVWVLTLADAVQALWILQAIAIALVLPWYAWRCSWKDNLLQSAILIAIPLPVYSISLVSAALSGNALLLGFLLLLALVSLTLTFIKLIETFVADIQVKALIRTTVQLGSAILIWTYRELWLSFIIH